MEWSNIITTAITSGTVVGLFELARDWRSKRKKDNLDNKRTDYEAQKQGLDLVQEFYNKVKQVTDDQNTMLLKRLDNIDNIMSDVVEYLNGDFKEWKEKHNA